MIHLIYLLLNGEGFLFEKENQNNIVTDRNMNMQQQRVFILFLKITFKTSTISEKMNFLGSNCTYLNAETNAGRKFRDTENPQDIANSSFAKCSF